MSRWEEKAANYDAAATKARRANEERAGKAREEEAARHQQKQRDQAAQAKELREQKQAFDDLAQFFHSEAWSAGRRMLKEHGRDIEVARKDTSTQSYHYSLGAEGFHTCMYSHHSDWSGSGKPSVEEVILAAFAEGKKDILGLILDGLDKIAEKIKGT